MKIHSEKGVSAIEFALILPILMMLIFGIIEFGILLFDKAVITNASREGARLGILYDQDEDENCILKTNDAEIRTVVKNYAKLDADQECGDQNHLLINLGSGGQECLTDGDIVIEPAEADRVSGGDLNVTVNFTYDFLILPNMTALVGGSFDGTMPLQGKTVMKMECF